MTCSMSRSGNVWDNSAMESFFSSLKMERMARTTYRTRDSQSRCVRLHREVLQSAATLDTWVSQSDAVRTKIR